MNYIPEFTIYFCSVGLHSNIDSELCSMLCIDYGYLNAFHLE